METENKSSNQIPWTWADQISSYRFWGIFLFFLFSLLSTTILFFFGYEYIKEFGNSYIEASTILSILDYAPFGGLWLAWFMVRLKNHFLLYLYSALTIIGLLLILFIPSGASFTIGFFFIGLSFGAIILAVPAIIAGGRGGSEMFVVSFGLIFFFERFAYANFQEYYQLLVTIVGSPKGIILEQIILVLIGTLLLIPVKAKLFNSSPRKREFSLTPKSREPIVVVLLCLIPLFNIYYFIHIAYRYHGEVNAIHPTQNILSPRAAAWCIILLSVLSPVMMASLNGSLTAKLSKDNNSGYYKNWAVILWSILFLPISYALIQSNINKAIKEG